MLFLLATALPLAVTVAAAYVAWRSTCARRYDRAAQLHVASAALLLAAGYLFHFYGHDISHNLAAGASVGLSIVELVSAAAAIRAGARARRALEMRYQPAPEVKP